MYLVNIIVKILNKLLVRKRGFLFLFLKDSIGKGWYRFEKGMEGKKLEFIGEKNEIW